jgi:hypothetical protein
MPNEKPMAAESDGNTANYAHALRKQPWNKLQRHQTGALERGLSILSEKRKKIPFRF